MMKFIYNTFFWAFAIYGLIEFLRIITNSIKYKECKQSGIYIVIAAKNAENTIEVFLRRFLERILNIENSLADEIIIADLGSEDKTENIIEKFGKDKNIKIIKLDSQKIL